MPYYRPKHHYVLHLPDMLSRFGTLISTFTHERKHRLVIRYSRDRHSLVSWELGALEEITCHQLWEMTEPSSSYMSIGLDTPHAPKRNTLFLLKEYFPDIADDDFRVASRCHTGVGSVSLDDLVLINSDGRGRVGEVLMLFSAGAQSWVVLAKWTVAGLDAHGRFARCDSELGATCMAPLGTIMCALTHKPTPDRRHTNAYIPFERRGFLSV